MNELNKEWNRAIEAAAKLVMDDAGVHWKGAEDDADSDDAETAEAIAMGLERLYKRIRDLRRPPMSRADLPEIPRAADGRRCFCWDDNVPHVHDGNVTKPYLKPEGETP